MTAMRLAPLEPDTTVQLKSRQDMRANDAMITEREEQENPDG